MLATGIVVFFSFYENKPLVSASGLVGGTILSRVGLRGFDLCAQLSVQEVITSSIVPEAPSLSILATGSRGRHSRCNLICRSSLAERF